MTTKAEAPKRIRVDGHYYVRDDPAVNTSADIAPAGEKCEWKRARAPMADWASSCGSAFYFDEEHTPKDAGFKYCPFCGKEIK